MKQFTAYVLMISLSLLMTGTLSAQIMAGDVLNESPLSFIPAEMSYDEFVDMNRRIPIGVGYVAWQYIKDYYYGIKTIEEKRKQ